MRITLKLVSAIFYQIFISHQIIGHQKNMKHVFYLILQALFIHEIFKFLYFHLPLFFSLSAIALEVDPRKISKSDVINCTENIRKNLDEGNVV